MNKNSSGTLNGILDRFLRVEIDSHPLGYYVMFCFVFGAALWPFLDIPGYYFTDNDTLGVLQSAKVHSSGDLLRILTESVKSALVESRYYRPVMTLSFSLDFALWEHDPFGYHLTNLILHALVAGLLFRLVYTFNDRDIATALTAGLLYTFHPLLMDVVPAVVRRQETLMATFMLAGLLAFHRYEYRGKNKWYLLAALTCFVLSVGSKEIGIIFAVLIPMHLWLRNPGGAKSLRDRTAGTLKRSTPYLVTAVLYFLWWCYVTEARAFFGGAAGFERELLRARFTETLTALSRRLSTNPTQYLRALFDPFFPDAASAVLHGLLDQTTEFTSAVFPGLSPPLVLLGVAVLASISLRRWSRAVELPGYRFMMTGFAGGCLGALSVLAVFPVLQPFFNAAVETLYRSEIAAYLPGLMASREHVSLSTYQQEYADLFKTVTRQIVYWTGLPYLGILAVKNFGRWFRQIRFPLFFPKGSMVWFYCGWLLIPGLFYGVTLQSIGPQNIYVGILPLSALLATLLSQSLFHIITGRYDRTSRMAPDYQKGIPIGRIGSGSQHVLALLVGVMVLVLLIRSPLTNDYNDWRLSAVNNRISMAKLEARLRTVPPHSRIELLNLPVRLGDNRRYPQMRYLLRTPNFYFLTRSQFADRELKVARYTFKSIRDGPEKLRIRVERRQLGSHHFLFFFRTRPNTGRPHYLPGAAPESKGGKG